MINLWNQIELEALLMSICGYLVHGSRRQSRISFLRCSKVGYCLQSETLQALQFLSCVFRLIAGLNGRSINKPLALRDVIRETITYGDSVPLQLSRSLSALAIVCP
jgi:hypothetical protein